MAPTLTLRSVHTVCAGLSVQTVGTRVAADTSLASLTWIFFRKEKEKKNKHSLFFFFSFSFLKNIQVRLAAVVDATQPCMHACTCEPLG